VKIAVLTLTRDRLPYTQACFASLHEYAGCDFDHYVLDQASDDGTFAWLEQEFNENRIGTIISQPENVGICRGMNELVELALASDDYDLIVKYDNDCQLTQPDTLKDVCSLVMDGGCILSPRILGLQNPPASMRELTIGAETILDVPQIGGIFMAIPAWVYDEFRYDESQTLFDDVQLCWWYRRQGGTCGYVKRLEAWHYLTTAGQQADIPDYFTRKDSEFEAAKTT
jgi:GT2 family glycosyltransferase